MISPEPPGEPARRDAGHSHIQGLDGLRGVAALAVLGQHLDVVRHQNGLFSHGYLAVDFFFLLSGLVIGIAYEPRMRRGLKFASYARIRLVRLYPMILLGAAMGCGAAVLSGVSFPIWIALLAQLAFVPFAVTPSDAYPLNGVQWSLFFELLANAVHAAVYRFLTTPVLAVAVTLSAVWLAIVDLHFGSLSVGFDATNFSGGFARVTFGFGAGLLIFRLHDSGRLPRLQVPYLLVAILLASALALPAVPMVRDWMFATILFPFILTLAISSDIPAKLRGPVSWAGAISYPLYAIHAPLLHIAADFVPRHAGGIVRAAYWLFVTLAIVIGATAIERFYDAPVRRWFQRRKALVLAGAAAV